MTKKLTPQEILAVPMSKNDAKAGTVGQYLIALAREVWTIGEGFSGKRPFGNSGWEYDIHKALVQADVVEGEIDEYGYLDDSDDAAVEEYIKEAFDLLYRADYSTLALPVIPHDHYVLKMGVSSLGFPEIVDSITCGYTKEDAEVAAQAKNTAQGSTQWTVVHIPK